MLKKVLATGLFFATSVAFAGGFGVVDMDKVVQAAPQVKVMQASIQKQFEPRQKAMMAGQKKFEADQAKFKKDQAVMSKSALQKAGQSLQAQAQKLQAEQVAYQRELMQAQQSKMQSFILNVKHIASNIAKKDKLDAVFPSNGLLWSTPAKDYTQKMIVALKKAKK